MKQRITITHIVMINTPIKAMLPTYPRIRGISLEKKVMNKIIYTLS